jgi:hypothetical protein
VISSWNPFCFRRGNDFILHSLLKSSEVFGFRLSETLPATGTSDGPDLFQETLKNEKMLTQLDIMPTSFLLLSNPRPCGPLEKSRRAKRKGFVAANLFR